MDGSLKQGCESDVTVPELLPQRNLIFVPFLWLQLLMNKQYIGFILAGLAGCLVVTLLMSYSGVGVSPDSVVYTSVARNIYANGHLEAYNRMPLVDFPVFYPLFLSVISFLTGKDPVVTGKLLNGILFAALIFGSGVMMLKSQTSRLAQWIFVALLAISPALLDIYTMLWSETLFIVLTVIFFLLLRRYFTNPGITGILLLASCAGISCITRYAGITLIGAGGLLLFFNRSLSWQKRFGHSILFGFVSISFLVANLLRNASITGTLTGAREKGVTSFTQNLYYYGTVLCDWLPFLKGHYTLATVIATLSLLAALVMFTWRIFSRWNYPTYPTIHLAFFLVYTLFIVVSATLSRYEQINNRLLSPAFIPLLFLIIYQFDQLSKHYSIRQKSIGYIPLLVLLATFGISQWQQTRQLYHEFNDYGIPGYTDDSWRHTQLPGYLKQHPHFFKPGVTIYSNAHEAAYFVDSLSAQSLPHTVDPEDMESFFADTAHYLLWYHQIQDPDLVSMDSLVAAKAVTTLYRDSTAIIYWCRNKN